MAKLDAYDIPLLKLSRGVHSFEFDLDEQFFADVDGDEVKKGTLKAVVTVTKMGYTQELVFELNGEVQIECTRCLDEMSQPIESRNQLVVKFGDEYREENDEVVIIPESEGKINIAWYLYEFIVLSIPISHMHELDECNQEMAFKLEELRAGNTTESDEESGTDPRWDALKGLDFKN